MKMCQKLMFFSTEATRVHTHIVGKVAQEINMMYKEM